MLKWFLHFKLPPQTHRAFLQRPPQGRQVVHGAPHLRYQALVGDIEAAQVEDVVNGFHLLHLDHPRVHGLRGLVQHLPQVVLSAVKDLE